MFQQRPMPPMPSRGFQPQRMQMGGQPFSNQSFGNQQARGFGPPRSFQPFGQQMGPFSSQFGPPGFGGQQFGAQQFGQQFGQQAMGRGGGIRGILSRFLPGGGQGAASAANAAQGLQGITNPANLSSMLGNVQKVLGMAQQVTPMVQQYGPLVRNLPAMIKIYSELKGGGSGDAESTESNAENTSAEVSSAAPFDADTSVTSPPKAAVKEEQVKAPAVKGASAPKLYI
ncbi:VrrA/YqfQ family protein [Peribacillus frigoritolerans]|uniref:VrrA/YqfQ family protein n=1 Tax=Peribacillus frigoritolerans TaxID=450367 RepID=UPI00256FE738|nr:VrrA/YqfQ family protein [Peribacillus frigoritolerans]